MHELSGIKDHDGVLAKAGAKLVVIDFHATWCGPCHAIRPVYERLADQYKQAVFTKCDVDKAKDVAQKYKVSAMPTFVFIKNGSVVDTLRGADPNGLQRKVQEHAGSADAGSFSGSGNRLGSESSSSKPASAAPQAPTGNTGNVLSNLDPNSLLHVVDRSNAQASNEAEEGGGLVALLNGGASGRYLQSDADEQLLIHLPLTAPSKLRTISFKTAQEFTSQAPKTVKIFVNRSDLGFDEADSAKPTEEFELKAGQTQGEPIRVFAVRYQNVLSLTIFVKDNQGGGDVTRIDSFDFIGTPGERPNISKIEKIGDD